MSNDLVIVDGFPALSTFVVDRCSSSSSASASSPNGRAAGVGSSPITSSSSSSTSTAAPAPAPSCSSSSLAPSPGKTAPSNPAAESERNEPSGRDSSDASSTVRDVPPVPFSSHPSALTFSSLTSSSSSDARAPFLKDARRSFTARTKGGGAAYSVGSTYFVPCRMKPRCALEYLALSVFRRHVVDGWNLREGVDYEPERSGAEWWTLVLDSSRSGDDTVDGGDDGASDSGGGIDKAREEKKDGGDDDDDDDDENDDNDDDDGEGDDEVALHFDADYGLESQLPNYMVHPRLATVTYLTSSGAPTVVFDRKSPRPEDVAKSSLNGPIHRGWISHPRAGKHVAFDGRLLHGAPGWFLPAVPAEAGAEEDQKKGRQLRANGTEGDSPATKKRRKEGSRMDDGSYPHSGGDEDNGDGDNDSVRSRITFLVNIWLNHCPIDAEIMEDEDVAEMCASFPDDDDDDDDVGKGDRKRKKGEAPFTFSLRGGEGGGEGRRQRDGAVIELGSGTENSTSGMGSGAPLDAVQLEAPSKEHSPAGEEETNLCGRIVTLRVTATEEACRAASRKAAACRGGGSASLLFPGGTVSLSVGKEVSSSDEGEDEDEDE